MSGCTSHLPLAHFSTPLVYLLEVGSLIPGRVSGPTAPETAAHADHVLLLVLLFCFGEILL